MKKIVKLSVATAMLMGMSAVSAQAADGVSVFDNVYAKGEIRPRYEMVDAEDNGLGNANAMTNRLVLGIGADIAGTDWLSVYGEMTDVHSLNDDNYNSTNNGNPNNKQVVADPEQTRLTQAYIDVKAGGALLRAGRQMINLDNQRFVGAVGWRQMPQTYDGFLLAYGGIEGLNLAAAYLTKVNTIKADDADHLNTRSVILHASYKVSDELTVTAYDYMLGASTGDNSGTFNGVGSDTVGIALTGKPKLGDITLNYRVEYAMMIDPSLDSGQYDSDANQGTDGLTPPTNLDVNDGYDADYYNIELGMNMSGVLAQVGYEYQSGMTLSEANDYLYNGGDNKTFRTALGTNHKFNGWADKFLSTPVFGLKDANVMLGYKSKDLGVFKVIYHDFQSAEESIDYGTEVDALYKRAIPGVKGLTGMVKYADYNADDFSVDTQKFWVMVDYKFSSK